MVEVQGPQRGRTKAASMQRIGRNTLTISWPATRVAVSVAGAANEIVHEDEGMRSSHYQRAQPGCMVHLL